MKAVNEFIIVEKHQEPARKVGGLLLTEKLDEDNRYIKGKVVSKGDLVGIIEEDDMIYYDKHAGHGIGLNDKLYQVIRLRDVVVVE